MMFARALYAQGADLPIPARAHRYTEQTVFHLTVGKEYTVAGMGLFDGALSILVCDETGKPNWLPVGLFDMPSQRVPEGWEFILLDGLAASGAASADRWMAKWGYPELVRNPAHTDELIYRDPAALEIFFKRLEEGRREPQ